MSLFRANNARKRLAYLFVSSKKKKKEKKFICVECSMYYQPSTWILDTEIARNKRTSHNKKNWDVNLALSRSKEQNSKNEQ